MLVRAFLLSCMMILFATGIPLAQDVASAPQDTTPAVVPAPASAPAGSPATNSAQPSTTEPSTVSPEGGVGVGVDATLSSANQAFLALYNRQFTQAKQLYENASSSNPEYQKMVDFCQNILDRMREVYDEYTQIYGKVMSPSFRMEQLKREDIDKMLDFQMRQSVSSQSLGEIGMISDIPLSDLGLVYEGADQLTLGEYLMWVKLRSANERVYYRSRKRAMDRTRIYSLQEIKQQQRQERLSRIEETRRRRLDRQGQGSLGIGGGGGGFGGGMGGGMMGGGFGGGMGGGMMGGGFGGGMGGGMGGF